MDYNDRYGISTGVMVLHICGCVGSVLTKHLLPIIL